MKIEVKKILHTDVLIIGGGTAGCHAAMTIREQSDYSIIIAEKANIRRSGCLAAGVNALNAYITKGHVPQDYVDYATKDADGIVRPDLLLTMSEGLNRVTAKMEQLGLVILKDENGEYVARGNRHIKIINLVHFFSIDRNYSRIIFVIIRKYIQKGSLSSSISSNKSINTSISNP